MYYITMSTEWKTRLRGIIFLFGTENQELSIATGIIRMESFWYSWFKVRHRLTTHPKFKLTRIQTYDLWIMMSISVMSLRCSS